jgi:hypothetical protein
MSLPQRFARRVLVCFGATIGIVTAHELVHIAVGHLFGVGGHFTNLTSADLDPAQNLAASAAARAWIAGSAPMFTVVTGLIALLAAPWARARRHDGLATVLGWIAIFGISYIGVQLMTLGGPAVGVDTAAVLVGYFGITRTPRALLALCGTFALLGAGYVFGSALGDRRVSSSAAPADLRPTSAMRRTAGIACAILSICSIAAGAFLLFHAGKRNPVGFLLLADILWGAAMLTLTPWQQPGPRFVRDLWLAPAVVAMGVLTIVGLLFPSDYSAATLFFLPQLATAAYAARNHEFRPSVVLPDPHR